MSEARVVASFYHILAPGFGGNSESVLTNLTNPEKWEVIDGIGGLQRQSSDFITRWYHKLDEDKIYDK